MNRMFLVFALLILGSISLAGQVAYCGTNQYHSRVYDYRPNDHSRTYSPPVADVRDGTIKLSVSGTSSETGLGYTLESHNSGNTWLRSDQQIPSSLQTIGNDFAEAPSDRRIQYRLLPDVGLYLVSRNGGASWRMPLYVFPRELKTYTKGSEYQLRLRIAAIDNKNPLHLYVVPEVEPWQFSSATLPKIEISFLLESSDGGDTWRKSIEGTLHSTPLGLDPYARNTIYAQFPKGLEVSADSGVTWEIVDAWMRISVKARFVGEGAKSEFLGAPRTVDIYQFAFSPTNIYLRTNQGVFRLERKDLKAACIIREGSKFIDETESIALDGSTVVLTTLNGSFLSQDGGDSFVQIYPPTRP